MNQFLKVYRKRQQTNSSKNMIQQNNKNDNKIEETRKIIWRKNRLSSQNHKNTNSHTQEDNTLRNQITPTE